jgi:predicted PurR-regulated permease PerM
MNLQTSKKIEITASTVFKTIGIIALVWFVVILKDVVALFFLSYILYTALNTIVNRLEKVKVGKSYITRNWGISIVSFGFVVILLVLISAIVGPTYDQAEQLTKNFDIYIKNIISKYQLENRFGNDRILDIQNQILEEIRKFGKKTFENPEGILSLGKNIFGFFLSVLTVLSLTFYQLAKPGKVKNLVVSFFEEKQKVEAIMNEVETKLGFWLRGQLFLMLIMSFVSFLAFSLIGIPFALPLAILVGVSDVVPIVGPIVGFVPTIIVALALGEPWQAIAVFVFLILLQQIEAHLFVPKIMEKSVGVDPIIVIVALVIGSQLIGILGAVLAVPISAVLIILYNEWQQNKNQLDQKN